jgi:lauroyl/myristoyl acyltransferase
MRDIVYKVLWSTIEDFVGLWEVLWELNSVLPEKSEKENQNCAKKILKHFLQHNLVIFYTNKWGSDELNELKYNEAIKSLEDEKYWNAPAINEMCIKIGNTEKGEKFYNEELVRDPI